MEFEKPKFGTKKWFENYWYHYKWHTIIGGFLLIMVVMFISDMLSREKFDCSVILATQSVVSIEQEARITELLQGYGEDLDGDGVVNIGLSSVRFPLSADGMNAQVQMAEQVRFMGEVSSRSTLLCILDDYTTQMLGSADGFIDLSPYNDKAFGEYNEKVLIKDTEMGADPLLAPVGDKVWVSFRAPLENDSEKEKQSYEGQKRLLEKLV